MTTLEDSIRRRLALLDAANADPELRALVMAHCKNNVVDWCNDFVWTTDPRRSPTTLPFDLFPKQEEFLNWLTERYEAKESAIADKSRDMGFTWLMVVWVYHRWLFYPGFSATFGSRKAGSVDTLGNPNSIFEKMRLLSRSLPWWMKPHPKRCREGKLNFINHENGASITGEGGYNMGRGGRSSIYLVDEAAFIERPETVDAAISNNSDVRLKISTPNGPGNPFAQQRHSGNFPVFSMHWLDDPRKNHWELRDESGELISGGNGRDAPIGAIYPWYEIQKKTLNKVILAQEVDLDYHASLEGVCIPNLWILAAVELNQRLQFPETGKIIAGFDVADGGDNKSVFMLRRGSVVFEIIDWSTGNTTQTAYKARDLGRDWGISRLNYDCDGPGVGVRGTLDSCADVPFILNPIRGNGKCSEQYWPEFGDRPSSDIFINARAEAWWLLRTRFERTYEFVNGIASHPIEELISIPNHGLLIGQLSQPLVIYTDTGKIRIESKKEMAKRGVSSPDYADACAYAYAPDLTPVWATSQAEWGY